MKKIALIIISMFIISLSAIFIFFPGKIKISNISLIACIPKNVSTCLESQVNISRWWPQQSFKNADTLFIYGGCSYKFTQLFTNGATIQLKKKEEEITTKLTTYPSGIDSSIVEWQASFSVGFNPFRRISQYFDAVEIKKNMKDILSKLVSFAVKPENIYGFPIQRTTFTDTILYATRFFTNTYPSVKMIYDHIRELKKKIENAGAMEKDYPMLNVSKRDNNQFGTMIAICIDKKIKADRNYFISMMVPMKDRFLETEVNGGLQSIKNAHQAIEIYMADHTLSGPAIPFEILITDRSKEADTAKWETKIIYPSM